MNKPVQITLGEPFDRIIAEEIRSGRFDTPEAVVEAGLRLLEAEQARYAKLHEALREGEESGEPIPFDPEEFTALMHKRHL